MLRPLTLTDLDAVIAVEQTVQDSLSWAPATHDEQKPIVEKGNAYGIFENDVLVGKVGFLKTEKDGWQVDGLIFDPQYYGKQYGTKLFRFALDSFIAKEHPSTLHLFVYPKNSAAITLYLHNGFVIHELVQNKYEPGKDRLKMIRIMQ